MNDSSHTAFVEFAPPYEQLFVDAHRYKLDPAGGSDAAVYLE